MSSPLAFQEAKVKEGSSLGSTRFVSLVSGVGVWEGEPERGGLGEQLLEGATGRVPLGAFCTFSMFW